MSLRDIGLTKYDVTIDNEGEGREVEGKIKLFPISPTRK
jgi:hypothetical protein